MRRTIWALSMTVAAGVFPVSLFGQQTEPSDATTRSNPQPVVLTQQIVEKGLRPLPENMPIRHIVVDRNGVHQGGVAGAVGTRVYQNTLGANFFAGDANVRYADDLVLIAAGGCDLSWLELFVTGGGDGSGPGFDAEFALYTACPNDGGVLIPGTEGAFQLDDDGGWLISIDLEGTEVAIPENPWIRLSTSTDGSGWVMGRPAQIGFTANLFDYDDPDPAPPDLHCNAWFGGTPYAGFYADMFCTGDVSAQYEAYRADNFSGFFDALTLTEQWADDIVPISAPGQCELVRYEASLAGAAGSFTMKVEVFSHDATNNRPMAPVPGTVKNCSGTGIGGALVNCVFNVFPGIVVPTPNMWLTYDVSSHQAGPVLAGDFPSVGFSEDGFSIFGNPDAGQWSQAVWFYGGCPLAETENPCGTFINTVYCAGNPPVGACCDVLAAETCVEGVSVSQCGGRWQLNSTCANAQFDPPCGEAACCSPNGGCSNETGAGCGATSGLWQPGEFCEDENHTCPPGACIVANNPCTEANDNAGGCSDVTCCALVCSADPFCCDVAFDVSCVNLGAGLCVQTVPNDACNSAIAIGDGSFNFDTTDATLDGIALPQSCNEGFGVDLGHDLWYDFTAPMTGTTTVDLCDGTDYDSRMAVYTGCACPAVNANIAGCNDDGCGNPPVVGGASSVSFDVTSGQCYKVRIGGFNDASGPGSAVVTTSAGVNCPSGAVTFVNPASGTVDARQPHPVNSTTPRQGINSLTVTGPAGADASCWSVCETVADGAAIAISNVSANGGNYTITLSRPITAGAVTTVSYTPGSGTRTTGSFISHPGNVNGDSQSAPTDILRIIDCLNNVTPNITCPWGVYSQDIDRSGALNPADVLRVIDILNGADAFVVWNNTPLPPNAGVCP